MGEKRPVDAPLMQDLFPVVDQRSPIQAAALEVGVALSLTQPWATLMAIGAKLNETRSWPVSYRGWFAVHASKGFPSACRALCSQEPFKAALARAGYKDDTELPRGQVIAVTRLLECVRTEKLVEEMLLKGDEVDFGDYSSGRFAFRTAGVRRLRAPIPMKGALSFWKMPQVITEFDLT